MRKILLIANQNAGRGSALSMMQRAKRSIWGYDCDFHLTSSREDVEKLFGETDVSKYKAVVCFGGDGTFNTILKYFLGTDTILVPIPTGSANDLANEIKLVEDWEKIIYAIENGIAKKIDVLTVNSIPFITVGGIGIGSKLVEEYNKIRETSTFSTKLLTKFKSDVYRLLALKSIVLSMKPNEIGAEIEFEGETRDIEIRSRVVFVTNQNHIAGDMKISENSENNDGTFELVVVPEKGKKHILDTMNLMYLGRVCASVENFKCKRLVLECQKFMSFYGDGEILATGHRFEIEILKESVNLVDVSKVGEL